LICLAPHLKREEWATRPLKGNEFGEPPQPFGLTGKSQRIPIRQFAHFAHRAEENPNDLLAPRRQLRLRQ
jgi:hypothetical protein